MTQEPAGMVSRADVVARGPVPLARAVLVDADEVWRVGLRLLLQEAGVVRVIDEARHGHAVLDTLRREVPELVLIDPGPARDRPLEIIQQLMAASAGTHVVLVAQSLPDDIVVEAVRLGVQGILMKGCDARSVLEAVSTTLRGHCALDPATTTALVRTVRAPEAPRNRFTARELEVLELVARGLSNRLVGRALFITEATVKFHLRNIMDKLGVRRRAAVVGVALREGLVPTGEVEPVSLRS